MILTKTIFLSTLNLSSWARVLVGLFLIGLTQILHSSQSQNRLAVKATSEVMIPTQTEPVKSYSNLIEAEIMLTQAVQRREIQVNSVRDYFSRRGVPPLTNHASSFVDEADKYGLDYRLLPAIATVESGGGRAIPYQSFNAWGWGVCSGCKSGGKWSNWDQAIAAMSHNIRNRYYNRGLTVPETIGRVYAADPNWSAKVRNEMNKIN